MGGGDDSPQPGLGRTWGRVGASIPSDPVTAAAAAAFGTKLPRTAFEKIQSVHKALVTDLKRQQAIKSRADRIERDIATMTERRLPSGVGPWKPKYETPELDNLYNGGLAGTLSLTIPEGTSNRDVKKLIYII